MELMGSVGDQEVCRMKTNKMKLKDIKTYDHLLETLVRFFEHSHKTSDFLALNKRTSSEFESTAETRSTLNLNPERKAE